MCSSSVVRPQFDTSSDTRVVRRCKAAANIITPHLPAIKVMMLTTTMARMTAALLLLYHVHVRLPSGPCAFAHTCVTGLFFKLSCSKNV